jgi:signal transduction histidine kinase
MLNEGQEKERKRIAGDLHDSLGQLLSTVKLTLTELQDSVEFSSNADAELMAQSVVLIDEACTSVREISHDLMPSVLIRLGLQAAISDMADKISRTNKIKVCFSSKGFQERLDENIEINIFRIVQELITNIIRHSCAKNVTIEFLRKENLLELIFHDDGIAYDKKALENSKGIGWANLNNRLYLLNATLAFENNVAGNSIVICLKL